MRYFQFSGGTIDFVTRVEFSKRVEYYSDFVLGGTRDRTVYGLTRITPQVTVAYNVNGLKFLQYVMGSISGSTIMIASTIPFSFYNVSTPEGTVSVSDAKVDTWELTIEEGSPIRAEFTAIARSIGASPASPYTPDFNSPPKMPSDATLTINGVANTLWNRLTVRIDNGIEPLFKTSTLPVELRETGLEVTGRLRAPLFREWASEGSVNIIIGGVGTIVMPSVKFTEVPPRVSGFDLPETEISFRAYPTATADAIRVFLTNLAKW